MTERDRIHLRGLPDNATCDVHDWPADGLGRRFVEEMKARHGKGGLNACGPCVQRARADAKSKANLPPHEHLRKIYVALDLEECMLHVVAGDEESLAWLDTPEVMFHVRTVYTAMAMLRIAKDPEPGMKQHPPGIVGPTIIAVALQHALRAAFPEEAIVVLPHDPTLMVVGHEPS